jgi:class 3 adenylate cyclase
VRVVPERFGKGDYADLLAPSRSDDALRGFFGRWERTAFNRVMAQAWTRWTLSLDLRAALPLISARALVLHHERSRYVPAAFGEYVASHIPGARFVSIPGQDSYLFRPTADDVVDVIEEFITGSAPVHEPDRALATVLFTDVVSSTEHVARLGDRKWREVLDEHDALVVRELERHRGRKVNPTGDGMVATFDGPARGVRCARAIIDGVRRLGVEVRAGLHTGEVELRGDDIGGIAVHIGQRVSALAAPGEVLVSRTVTDLVAGSGLEFDERGEHELKGVPGKWAIYAVRP